jgi:hypothetical protein
MSINLWYICRSILLSAPCQTKIITGHTIAADPLDLALSVKNHFEVSQQRIGDNEKSL